MIRSALNCGVAPRAQAYEVWECIGIPVIFEVKLAPRGQVMNVHWPSQLGLGYAALLAGVFVALAGLVLLEFPVRTAPLDPTALPVAVVIELMPRRGTLVGAKPPRARSLHPMPTAMGGFAALFARKEDVLISVSTLAAAVLRLAFAGFVNHKRVAAIETRDFYSRRDGTRASVGTKAVLAFIVREILTTVFARKQLGRIWVSQRSVLWLVLREALPSPGLFRYLSRIIPLGA